MNTYKMASVGNDYFILKDTDSNKYANHEYFAGYDFMGSANWEKLFSFDYALGKDEALMILKDLRAAE